MITIHYDFTDGTELSYVEGLEKGDNFTTCCLDFFNIDCKAEDIKVIDKLGNTLYRSKLLENTGKYRQDLRRQEYGDERDPDMREFLNQISPLTNAHKITKPLFVIQGLNDPRVPVSEAEQIVKAVRKNKVDVWYLLAEDEGHGLAKKTNRDFYQQAKVMFIKKYLLGK